MKRLIFLLCLLALCLLASCSLKAAADPEEKREFTLDGVTLTLPEGAKEPRWSELEGGGVQAEFSWGGDAFVYRVKKTGRLENLSDMRVPVPEGGELPENAPRCVVDGSKGFFAWYVRGHSFSLSMEENASSDKLHALYNLLLMDKILSDFTQPPELKVRCGSAKVTAVRTTYDWKRRNHVVFADGIHPLQMLYEEGRVNLTSLPVPAGAEIRLDFELAPDELTLRCWSEEAARAVFGNPDLFSVYTEQATELPVTEGRFAPPGSGNYIYELVAEWSDDSGHGGTAYYGFYTRGDQAE